MDGNGRWNIMERYGKGIWIWYIDAILMGYSWDMAGYGN
jgi:hypothetical protein